MSAIRHGSIRSIRRTREDVEGVGTRKERFGAVYLNAAVAVAAANARKVYQGEIATLFDLRPESQPDVVIVDVVSTRFVDVVSARGIAAIGLRPSYPIGVPWMACQAAGLEAYQQGERGVACRSNAEATTGGWIGEKLAVFDTANALMSLRRRLRFAEWYPLEVPRAPTQQS